MIIDIYSPGIPEVIIPAGPDVYEGTVYYHPNDKVPNVHVYAIKYDIDFNAPVSLLPHLVAALNKVILTHDDIPF